MERAVFVPDLDRLPPPGERYDRLYLGSEFCVRRLPGKPELLAALAQAARHGMTFTLVTPFLDEPGLACTIDLVRALPNDSSVEVVANDLGLLEALRGSGWDGTLVAGRLLTRQRRGPGFQSFGDVPPEAVEALRGSALESPAFVRLLAESYGVHRFELDDLVQGIAVPSLPQGVRLSLCRPWLLVTATRNCPWVFDERTWDREHCARPCRGRLLRLERLDSGRHEIVPEEAGAGSGVLSLRTSTVLPRGPGGGGLPSAPPLRPERGPSLPEDIVGVARSGGPPAARSSERAPTGVQSDRTPTPGTGNTFAQCQPLILGGCAQFLEHRSDAPPPPGVDRIVWQPEVPA